MPNAYKTIATLPNGKTDFPKDYTKFWYDNVVPGDPKGLVTVSRQSRRYDRKARIPECVQVLDLNCISNVSVRDNLNNLRMCAL